MMRPKERGRRTKVRMRGGRSVVYGRVARRKDCRGKISSCEGSEGEKEGTYGELATAPEALDDAQIVEADGCEEHLGGVCEAQLRRASVISMHA